MVKTFEEYYNDPRIMNEPSAMREIHAIRLLNNDERRGMTWAEYNNLVNRRVGAFLAEYKERKGLV